MLSFERSQARPRKNRRVGMSEEVTFDSAIMILLALLICAPERGDDDSGR